MIKRKKGFFDVERTFWLSPKLWKDYYREYMKESGDGKISKERLSDSTGGDGQFVKTVPIKE